MTKPWSDMTDREQDAALAKAMGWSPVLVEHEMSVFALNRVFLEKGDYYYKDQGGNTLRLPTFTSSLDAMRLVEDVIEERGLWLRYTQALYDAADFETLEELWWWLLRATPAQRAEAVWRTLKHAMG